MCEYCGGDCNLTNGIYKQTKEPYIDFMRRWRTLMPGECDKFGHHPKIELRKRKLKIAKIAYKEITTAIKQIEERFLCSIDWDEFINVDGEGFGFFELTENNE